MKNLFAVGAVVIGGCLLRCYVLPALYDWWTHLTSRDQEILLACDNLVRLTLS